MAQCGHWPREGLKRVESGVYCEDCGTAFPLVMPTDDKPQGFDAAGNIYALTKAQRDARRAQRSVWVGAFRGIIDHCGDDPEKLAQACTDYLAAVVSYPRTPEETTDDE